MRELVGDVPTACAWWAFHDLDVVDVLRAYDFWEPGLSEWWGDDPPYWLVLGVAHYHRARNHVEADALKQLAKKRDSSGGSPAGGFSVRG